jgi:hypothetical protein
LKYVLWQIEFVSSHFTGVAMATTVNSTKSKSQMNVQGIHSYSQVGRKITGWRRGEETTGCTGRVLQAVSE